MSKEIAKTKKAVKAAAIVIVRPGNVFDTFTKQMFGRVFVFTDFMVSFADQIFVSKIDLAKIEAAPTHYISLDGNERIADLVFRCPLKDGKSSTMAVIIFEHQSGSLKKIPLKLLKYIAAIWNAEAKEGKPLSAPYFIMLRTGKKPHKLPLPKLSDMLPKDQNGKPIGKLIDIEYDVVDLPAKDFKTLKGGPELRLVVGMLKKMSEGKEIEFPEALAPLLEIADAEERTDLLKILLEFAAKVMGSRSIPFEKEAVTKALTPIIKDKEEMETMVETIFDRKFAEGWTKGVAEERMRGEVKVLHEKAELIMTFLRARFEKVPESVERKIRSTGDTIVLDSWAAHAGSCQTMKEFEEAIL